MARARSVEQLLRPWGFGAEARPIPARQRVQVSRTLRRLRALNSTRIARTSKTTWLAATIRTRRSANDSFPIISDGARRSTDESQAIAAAKADDSHARISVITDDRVARIVAMTDDSMPDDFCYVVGHEGSDPWEKKFRRCVWPGCRAYDAAGYSNHSRAPGANAPHNNNTCARSEPKLWTKAPPPARASPGRARTFGRTTLCRTWNRERD